MKKKLVFILPIIIAIIAFIGTFLYFNLQDKKTALTILEKRWLEKNVNKMVDIEVVNNYPLYGVNGKGVFFDFLNSFQEDTKIEFNKIPYLKESNPSSDSYKFRILHNNAELTTKDLLVFEDSYVLIGRKSQKINTSKDINNMIIGAFNDDIAELSYYLKNSTGLTYKPFNTIDEIFNSLDNGTVDMIIIPNIMYLDKTLGNANYYYNYYFTELSKKVVLTLSDNNTKLNGIVKKYYENWKNKKYVSTYNKELLNHYIEANNINDKVKADMLSKTYVYGYVANAPYEVKLGKELVGIAGEYINRIERLTNIDFVYKEYKNKEDLKKAIQNREVDIYFDYYNYPSNNYVASDSPFVEEYVVLGKSKDNHIVTSFEELKGKKVNMLENSVLTDYFTNNSRALIETYKSLDSLVKKSKNNLIVVDKEVYNYYRNTRFEKYEAIYVGKMTNDYRFMIQKGNDAFYGLFNYTTNSNSYYKYRNSGISSISKSLKERTTFEEFYLIILCAIFIPLTIIATIFIVLKKKQAVKVVKKEERRKYTDLLTSLKNRNYLNLNIENWEACQIYPQSIVIIDLNNVKYVNDNYGHEAGDDLIVKAAATLVNNQLENSEIIRTDGNEFLVYLIGYSERQIETYTKKLAKEFKDLPYGFGAAIGFSMINDDIKLIDDAINEATLEMRTNKDDYK